VNSQKAFQLNFCAINLKGVGDILPLLKIRPVGKNGLQTKNKQNTKNKHNSKNNIARRNDGKINPKHN